MLARRISSTVRDRSPWAWLSISRVRKSSGVIRWLEIMIDSAMDDRITIEVPADSPPMKARMAIHS